MTARAPALLFAVIAIAALNGCGGSGASASSSDPGSAARAFVAAVTGHDRDAWCAQIGWPLGSPSPHPLSSAALAQCRQDNLFEILGSCDVEGAIRGATVSDVSTTGQTSQVRLSSGARLTLRRVGGYWLVDDWRPGAHVVANGCAGDVPTGAPTA